MNGKRFWPLLLLPLLLGAAFAQAQADRLHLPAATSRSLLMHLPATTLQKINWGYDRATADWLWLLSIQSLADSFAGGQSANLASTLNTITDLDRHFIYPHLFGGLILPLQDEPAAALTLLEKGLAANPQNGMLAYYAGATAQLHLKDAARAARYFQQAATLPDAPAAAATLAGVNLAALSDRDFALAWWEGIIATEQNPAILERAIVWRDHLLLVIELEELIATAKENGTFINSLEDLVRSGWLAAVPDSPLGRPLLYDYQSGSVDLAPPT